MYLCNNINIQLKVDLQLQSKEGDIATFIENSEWALLGMQWKEDKQMLVHIFYVCLDLSFL